jgi:hypothetical protein
MKNTYRSLRHLYWESTGPTRALTLVMYPAAVYGLMRAFAINAKDTDWMFHLLPMDKGLHALMWGLLITYVWIARLFGLFYMDGYKWTLRTTPLIGVSFWLALLVSNILNPGSLAFGFLYTVPVLMEAWILSRNWLETK